MDVFCEAGFFDFGDGFAQCLDLVGKDEGAGGIVGDEKFAGETSGVFEGGGIVVFGNVGSRETEVAFGEVGVVGVPVGDGRVGETGFEALREFEHGVNDGVRAVVGAPDADAVGGDERLGAEISDDFAEVNGFLRAEAEVNIFFEQVRVAAGTADIDGENEVAFAHHGTVPLHLPGGIPGIGNDATSGAGEGIDDDGIFFGWVEIGGLVEAGGEEDVVVGFDGDVVVGDGGIAFGGGGKDLTG